MLIIVGLTWLGNIQVSEPIFYIESLAQLAWCSRLHRNMCNHIVSFWFAASWNNGCLSNSALQFMVTSKKDTNKHKLCGDYVALRPLPARCSSNKLASMLGRIAHIQRVYMCLSTIVLHSSSKYAFSNMFSPGLVSSVYNTLTLAIMFSLNSRHQFKLISHPF